SRNGLPPTSPLPARNRTHSPASSPCRGTTASRRKAGRSSPKASGRRRSFEPAMVDNVTREVPGVTPHHEEVVSFAARQWLDIFSPSNMPLTNPEVIEKGIATGGANFVEGFRNWVEDGHRVATGQPPVGAENFVPGRDVAV